MYKKIISLFMVILLIGIVSADIGSNIRYNDDGAYLQLLTSLPQTLVTYLITFPQVNSGEAIGGFTYLYLASGLNLNSINRIGYLMSLRNEMLTAQNLFIQGYEYPDFCKREPNTGTTYGLYYNLALDEWDKVINDPKCPT